MGRPAKKKPTHSSGRYVIKKTTGYTIEGKPIRTAFYSTISLDDCERKYENWKIANEVTKITGVGMENGKGCKFEKWAKKWLEVYKKPNVSKNTYSHTYENTVEKHLLPYFSKANLTDIRPADIQAFFATKSNLSESMLNKMKMCLYSIFETAIDNDLCYKNPAKNVSPVSQRKKNVKRVFTDGQIRLVVDVALFKMPEIVVLLETGVRRGELLGLKWEDIDLKNNILSVKRSIADDKDTRINVNPPKWNSFRDIPFSSDLAKLFDSMIYRSEYVFVNSNTELYKPDVWSNKLKKFMKNNFDSSTVPSLTAHEMRHTFGTALRRRGVDIYTIQKVMGHKDIKMTSELYVHNEIETLRKAMKN